MVVGIFLYYAAEMLQCLVVEAFRLPYIVYDLFAHVVVRSASLVEECNAIATSWLLWH